MSFSFGCQTAKDTFKEDLQERIEATVVAPSDDTNKLVSVAQTAIEEFFKATKDDGRYSVSASGHAQVDGLTFRDSLSISISPVS